MEPGPTVAWINGEVVPWSRAALPLEDRGLQFSESLYEVLPITAGRARLLDEHVARMRRAAELLGLGAGVPATNAWADLANRLIQLEGLDEGLLYAQLTGGVAPRAYLPATAPRPNFFAYAIRRRLPRAAQARQGIRAITRPDTRWDNPYLKTTMLLPTLLAKREASRRGAQEALLLGPDGTVREGASSNVFLVRAGQILTPQPTPHVLPGITGPLVASLARESGRGVREAPIVVEELYDTEELFITSTSQLVMGITHLDDRPIGPGRPGPMTLDLARRLRGRLDLD
jgi:D-alanine transaminase